MSNEFEYTTLAHRYTAKFPLLTYVGTQANFWIITNFLLVIIMYFQFMIISQNFNIPLSLNLRSIFFYSFIWGIVYGAVMGLSGYYLDRIIFKKLSIGKVILFKGLGALVLLSLLFGILKYFLSSTKLASSLNIPYLSITDDSWGYILALILIYYFFMTLIISFINQVNKKYGPGVLIPLLLGRYRNPKEEEKIFMFMDLKSSTTTAEKLGHLAYSSFIRDCFADINENLFPYHAQVYQYVGDEIVLMWPAREGIKNHHCIKFYFACKKRFKEKAQYYMSNYGLTPEFKAGVHIGMVTAVEIGEIKKNIAYHGDTLNTAARIQSLCNEFDSEFLISENLLERVGIGPNMTSAKIGQILLRGKTEKTGIMRVVWQDI